MRKLIIVCTVLGSIVGLTGCRSTDRTVEVVRIDLMGVTEQECDRAGGLWYPATAHRDSVCVDVDY